MSSYPPRPKNISIPAVVAGNILETNDASVSVVEDGYNGSIIMKTDNKLAMVINPTQQISINTQLENSMLTINNNIPLTSTFRLSYQDSYYFDGRVTANGDVLFEPTCLDTTLDPNLVTAFKKNFDISDHDGASIGFQLGGRLVTAMASELNYVDVPAGQGRPNKALVLDGASNINGVNQFSAVSLAGTLLTGPQPNITRLENVNITSLSIGGEPLDVDPITLRYLKVINEGVAYASKAVILDFNKNFSGINTLVANTITGTLTAGPQPNISSLSALSSLTNNGPTTLNGGVNIKTGGTNQLTILFEDGIYSTVDTNISGDMVLNAVSNNIKIDATSNLQIPSHNGTTKGLYLGSTLVTASASQLNYTNVVAGTASANKALVLDQSSNITGINQLAATTLVGTMTTGSQPFITSVSTLNISKHNGTVGLSLNGTIITASATQLNYTNVVPGTATANKAIVLDNNGSISGLTSVSASTLTGVITTPTQPNINSVNTLTILNHNGTTGLILGSTLVTATGADINRISVNAGIASAGKALVVDGALNIVGINNFTASNLTGIIQTPVQPNINQVNTLNIANHDGGTIGLSLNGTLITATASQLNRVNVTAGVANRNQALVLDSSFSIGGINILNANTLGGVLSNPTQPNVRNLSSINIIDHNGINTGLSLNGVLITSTANQLNYVEVQQGIGSASKALVLDSSLNITNINTLTATSLYGTVLTPSQPNITRVATLNIMNHDGSTTGLSLGGTLVSATATQINTLTSTPGVASSGKALILDSSNNISGINSLAASKLVGTLSTSNQPNITAVNTLNIATHNGSIGLSLGGFIVTASAAQINSVNTSVGSAAAGKALVLDNSLNIVGINSLSAKSLVGVIQTGFQPNITSVSTLNINNHDGATQGLVLNGVLVSATATQLNYNSVSPGTATALHSLVTDGYNSISGINTLTATKVVAGQLSLTGVIANFNTGGVIIKTYSFTDLVGRVVDIELLSAMSFNNFQPAGLTSGYSSEIIGYINPQFSETYTFYITCNDRIRLWVNGQMLLNSWTGVNGSRVSSSIFLNANQWVPIYMQYQVDAGDTPSFLFEWVSNSTPRGQVASALMAWDNNPPAVSSNQFSENTLTIYNTSTASANTSKFSVDTSGDLTIDSSGNNITLGSGDNFNIPSHNGTSKGLYLGGTLVLPTAYELNYLKVNPGTATASHAVVLDASSSISGINSITATSLAVSNLTTNSFTISNLTLSGPLNNYNTGSLLIRQITGQNVSGRVVNVDTITDINLNKYDPRGLNTNYSLDIIGYVLPTYTEPYVFYATANDRVRIWIGNTLILNVWNVGTGLQYSSTPITLTAGQWVPIYIQFQDLTDSQLLQVQWSSTSLIKSSIPSSAMAWDNSFINPHRPVCSPDQITLYSSASGLTTVQTGTLSVDGNGNMTMASMSGLINIAPSNNFNIKGHNGTTNGLQLAGTLVLSTAAELNYLSGATPGTASASKAIILDSSKSLSGFTSISSNNLIGTLQTASQPNITSIGTLSSTLNTSADIVLGTSNLLRLSSDSTTCYIQAGSASTTNAAADLLIGNYGTTSSTSTRSFMIKSTGFVGVQTTSPARTLSINGAGSQYCMRLINNNATGSETSYCDLGVDTSSNLLIGSNVIIGSTGTANIKVNNSGVMNILPSGGSLQIGNATSGVLPLEVGSASFTLNSVAGYINSAGSAGAAVCADSSYSIRTSSSIIVNGTVCITSDRRLKEQVQPLSYDDCKRFILDSHPVQFQYIRDLSKSIHCGLIAQDVAKGAFSNLVKTAPCEGLELEFDSDGYASPADAAFNISYEEIIPILMTTMKEAITENESLKEQLNSMNERMKIMEQMMSHFVLSMGTKQDN